MELEYKSAINVKLLDAGLQKLASNFSCGNTSIDSFLKSEEALNCSFGKTYVWLEEDNKKIIGFYNISAGSIDYVDHGIVFKMGGAIHINDFAIATDYQRSEVTKDINMSDLLLDDCLRRIEAIRTNFIGCAFVTLQSTQEGYNLYKRHDFEEIEEDMSISKQKKIEAECMPMYLVLDIV